ncbi:MAG: ABC transporter ATP-binding protein [Anaerolineales bacterium]|nr:ABC transporter ATP-binding protein [Anaerolineales bacterium]
MLARTDKLTFRYPQGRQSLYPVDLQVAPGELWLVQGASGCGKSTLARCLSGLIPHLYHGQLQGEVWLNGNRSQELQLWQLAERVGMVFQNPSAQMLASTVEDEIIFGLENLGLGRTVITNRLEAVLDQFQLQRLRRRSPHTLSGGEQQKLALAAIVARQPQLLVFDEPLSMLDSTAASELVDYIASLPANGRSAVIFEHRHDYLAHLPALQKQGLACPAAMPAIPDIHLPMDQQPEFGLNLQAVSVRLGERAVLKDLNLDFAGGQLVAIVGRNGVGKTTLLRVLAGLQSHAGRVVVSGSSHLARPDLGLVFQNPDLQIFNPSVRQEILYRLPEPDLAFYQALVQALGLAEYEEKPPLLLSEGEKKRLALAIMLMRRPRHGILLDEPSLGQDERHKQILMRLLKSVVAAGYLVVMTTHDLGLAAQADRLLVLGEAGFLADGPPTQVFADSRPWQQAGILLPDWFRASLGEAVAP